MVIFNSYVKLPEGTVNYLVGGFKHEFYGPFHINGIYNPNPIDELHQFFKMVIAPPTSDVSHMT